jgi:flagellar motor component MotA
VRLRTLALACVAAWIGIAAFFSFVVAPLVFQTVDRTAASVAVSAVLPRYYVWGVVLASVALVTYVALAIHRDGGRLGHVVAAALCATMLAGLGGAWLVVLPRAEAARRARADTAFARAHRSAIQLNGLTLAAGAALLVLETFRRGPRRSR